MMMMMMMMMTTCDEYPGYGQLLVIHGYPWIVSVFFWLFRCEMTVVFTVVCSCLHEWALEDYLQLQRCDFFHSLVR